MPPEESRGLTFRPSLRLPGGGDEDGGGEGEGCVDTSLISVDDVNFLPVLFCHDSVPCVAILASQLYGILPNSSFLVCT